MTTMTVAAATAKFRWRPVRRYGVPGRRSTGQRRPQQQEVEYPRLLQLAIHNDEKLSKLLNGVTITQNGSLPKILVVLLPNNTEKWT